MARGVRGMAVRDERARRRLFFDRRVPRRVSRGRDLSGGKRRVKTVGCRAELLPRGWLTMSVRSLSSPLCASVVRGREPHYPGDYGKVTS